MRALFFLIFLNSMLAIMAQSKLLTGKVISDELDALPKVKVFDTDTTLLGATDLNGDFQIKTDAEELIFSWIGMEWTHVMIPEKCNYLEVIMIADGTYHYRSHRKVDRIRKRRFNERMALHSEAFSRGLFKSTSLCGQYRFIHYKPDLDEIRVWLKDRKREIKESFHELAIGDTIYVPYGTTWRHDGTDRTSLHYYASFIEETNFKCMIQGKVLDMNTKKNGFNIRYEVTDCSKCNYQAIHYHDKDMKVGAIFHYNMKYFKLITER